MTSRRKDPPRIIVYYNMLNTKYVVWGIRVDTRTNYIFSVIQYCIVCRVRVYSCTLNNSVYAETMIIIMIMIILIITVLSYRVIAVTSWAADDDNRVNDLDTIYSHRAKLHNAWYREKRTPNACPTRESQSRPRSAGRIRASVL